MPRTYVFSVPIGPAHIDRLPQTLKSLAAQSVPVKVALCDASGSAKCKAIADAFPDLIAYRRHGPDKGQSDAINEGWREVEGDVYSWLNADDYLAPDALDIVERAFDDNLQAEIVYGQSLILEEDGTYIGLHPAVSPDIDLITRSNIISQPSCFYKGDLIKALGPVRQELDLRKGLGLGVENGTLLRAQFDDCRRRGDSVLGEVRRGAVLAEGQ